MTAIIPAPAGYFGLWRIDAQQYGRSPIIAWSITEDGCAWPWIDGEQGTDIDAILCPDGTVNQHRGGVFWKNVATWMHETRP